MNWIVFISLLLPGDIGFADVFGKKCKFCWLFNQPVEETVKKEEPKEQVKKKDSYHVYYFTASWCGPCQTIKAGLHSLQEVGWKVGSEKTDHIQVIDIDKNPDLFNKHRRENTVPQVVAIKNGKAVGWLTPESANQISHFYYQHKK